jgi:hypothetical protein
MPQASCHVLSRAVICCHVLTVTSQALNNQDPYLVLMRHFAREDNTLHPDVLNLKTYGCTTYVYDNSIRRGNKFAARVLQGILVGYKSRTIYRV